jgi:hypothetical protein
MNKPHRHADVIKAWADGAQVEVRRDDGTWVLLPRPSFQARAPYRVHDPLREYKEAYARGENIEVYCCAPGIWEPFDNYQAASGLDTATKWVFMATHNRRLRIAPKPDYTTRGMLYASPARSPSIGVKVTVLFDGETNKPKAVELIK